MKHATIIALSCWARGFTISNMLSSFSMRPTIGPNRLWRSSIKDTSPGSSNPDDLHGSMPCGDGKTSVSLQRYQIFSRNPCGNGLKCADCHTSRENHGKTFLKNCSGCHHGKEIQNVRCEDCHVPSRGWFRGKGGSELKSGPAISWMVRMCRLPSLRGAKKKDTFDAIKKRCVECHDQSYGEMVVRGKRLRGIVKKGG